MYCMSQFYFKTCLNKFLLCLCLESVLTLACAVYLLSIGTNNSTTNGTIILHIIGLHGTSSHLVSLLSVYSPFIGLQFLFLPFFLHSSCHSWTYSMSISGSAVSASTVSQTNEMSVLYPIVIHARYLLGNLTRLIN